MTPDQKKKRRLRALGAGLLAGGMGLRGATVLLGLPSMMSAAMAGAKVKEAVKNAPHVDVDAHMRGFLKEKGVNPDAIRRVSLSKIPLARLFQGGEYKMAPGGIMVGGKTGPKAAAEHAAGHFIKGHAGAMGAVKNWLGKRGINYRKFVLKPELEAWRQAKPGAERRDLRRLAMAAHKKGRGLAYARGMLTVAQPMIWGGLGLIGLSGIKRHLEKKKQKAAKGDGSGVQGGNV